MKLKTVVEMGITNQRIDEWIKTPNLDYFDKQFENPYRSTIIFCKWL
ncbi:MAG: hypothetical protein Q8880_08585 [Bacteroidota bacterium]|nr:hypothetical protein [Bacteroidota bacterium]